MPLGRAVISGLPGVRWRF